jgi:hypothetical protein
VTDVDAAQRFSRLFDRAVAACAQTQLLATRCRELQSRARATHASARRIRALASDTREAWAHTNEVFDLMRREVEAVASAMRASGVERAHAGAAIRAHMRFVLYDGGLREQEAETVVERATEWVDLVYAAA